MFKLQRLEITGFKSFADYTELVFTGEGITAVVGPNGCGKSNVADAIAWVLGEQRAKQLRGAEMKDVIFQGSRGRAASGMAEVVLHLMRDETVVEDSEVEDIDSTLEGIDDQSSTFEEGVAPEVAGEKPAGEAADENRQNVRPSAALRADRAGPAIADLAIAEIELATASVDQPVAAEGELAATPDSEAAMTKARGKRHWRPSRIALEFVPGETVTVTRRLYLSGESEYLLNGRQCRLRDIQDLFSGTGLAGAHYAIIEQGRIGQILSAKPMDRRTLIEEAAGITKFRVRQRAAEARLETARGNLHRVSDIISEIERQVGSLRRQATKARRYSQLREELREALREVFVADERAVRALLDELRTQLAEASGEEQRLSAELAAREEETRQATAVARASEEELARRRAAAAAAALQRDRSERERVYQQEQVAALDQRLTEIEPQSEAVSERLVRVEAEGASLREREAEVRAASEETARLVASAEAAYAERTHEVAQAEMEIEQTRAELLTHTAVTERLMEIGRQLEAALDRLAAQAEGLAREQVRAAAAHAESTSEAERIRIELGDARLHLEQLAEERETAVEALTLARGEAAAAAAEHARIRDEAAGVRHRLDTLAELDAKRELYSEAVQHLFASSEVVKDFHSIGTLVDVLRVEPQWEQAVESALGPFLQSVIVPTPDDALRAALWLKEKDWGRATFLVAGLHGASVDELNEHTAHAGIAFAEETDDTDDLRLSVDELQDGSLRISDLLWAPTEILQVLDRTLAREMRARLAENLDGAMIKSLATGDAYVTREGEWVAGGQLLSAGSFHNSGGSAGGLLAFKREMRALELRAIELDREVAAAAQSAGAARHKLDELEDALVLLNEIIGREERDQMARELHAARVKQDIERAERHLRVVADEAARLAEEKRQLEGRRATAAAEAEAAEASRLACLQRVAEAAEALAVARRAAEAESEHLSRQHAAAAAASERRRAAVVELRRMEAEATDLRARSERQAVEIRTICERIEELRRSIVVIDKNAETVASESAVCEQEVEQAARRLIETRERSDALALDLTELNRLAASIRDERAALDVARAEAAARLNYLHEACVAELAQPLEELSKVCKPGEDFDLEAARARVEELRARVESFGAVNMMALEELAEAEERFSFLTGQWQDIVDGIASTEEALREIKRRSRERFRQAFEVVNRNFAEMFTELFGGGRGEMSLIDADDVLESGIDLIAQPPGKRLQNVLLLSGGEKAMAALALLLAVFRYRPSPFCLLDEVDAPLDEANVGRFTNKIVEMSANTQFIVITHNKKTMEAARALYGVTMEEAGISKVVSVKFE